MARKWRTVLQRIGRIGLQSVEELLINEFPAGDAFLLLNVWMPGMNGIELCRSLAASGRHLPTILMSGLDDEQTKQNHARSQTDCQIVQAIR